MLGKKFDHESIKEPRLLHLTGVAGSGQYLNSRLGMRAVITAGQNDRRAGDAVLHVGSDASQFGSARTEGES